MVGESGGGNNERESRRGRERAGDVDGATKPEHARAAGTRE